MNANQSHISETTADAVLDSTITPKPRRTQPVLGIIGGSGPEAGADLFHKVLAVHRRKLGSFYTSDRDAPNLLLSSVADLGGPGRRWISSPTEEPTTPPGPPS